MATIQEMPMRQVNGIRQRPATMGRMRTRAATRRLSSLGVALLLVAGFSPAGRVEQVAAETPGNALGWDNPPFLSGNWPYLAAGIPGQTIDVHAAGFSVQWGYAPTVTYTALTPEICTLDGAHVTIQSTGECTFHASIPGDQMFAASGSDLSFVVGAQQIQTAGDGRPSGTVDGLELLRGAASSGLPLAWAAPATWEVNGSDPPEMMSNACTVEATADGPALRYADAPGTCRVIASQAGDDAWAPAVDVTQEFEVVDAYTATWSVTSPDSTPRTDGTVRTGDLLSVEYAATSAINICSIEVRGRSATSSFPGVLAPDGLGCHFEYTIPPLPDPRSTGPAACSGPFGGMLDCDGWAEVCVRASIVTSSGGSALDVADRDGPYPGHCTSTFDEGLPITPPGEYLQFHDVAPGPANYTFASEPQVLSWNQADWGTPTASLHYGSPIHLEMPSWIDSCTGVSITVEASGLSAVSDASCPSWDLTIPARSAHGGSPDSGGTGNVSASYLVDGQEAFVWAPLPVDTGTQDFSGPYGSSLPALLPATAADEVLATDATTWEPSFTVFGTGAAEPTSCTLTIENLMDWENPFRHTAAPVDRTCAFSIPATELADSNTGGFQGYEVTADFLDGDGQPTREPLRWWSQPRVAGSPAAPVVQALGADAAGTADGTTLVGAGAADPNVISTEVSVAPIAAAARVSSARATIAGAARVSSARAAIADAADACSASRSRAVGSAAVPVYVACALAPGDYVATATATAASGESATSTLAFTVASPDTTKPAVTLEAVPATSPTNVSSFDVTATFDEPVTGFDAGDVTLGGTSTGWSVGTVSGSNTTYTFAVSASTSPDGTLTIAVPADGATDAATNGNTASNDLHYAIDRIAPAAILSAPASPTGAQTLSYSLAFDEPVAGLAAADLAVSGTSTGCLVGTPSGAEGAYTVDLTGCSEGTVILTLNAASVTDLAGNPGPDSSAAADTVTIDRIAPGATLSCVPGPGPTKATALACTVTFTEEPAGSTFTEGDVLLGGSATGWVAGAPAGSGTGPYPFIVNGAGADGTLTLAVAAGAINDAAGNATMASATLVYVMDRTVPRTTAPTAVQRVGGALSGASIPLAVRWTGSDAGGSGVARYELARSTNGGATWRTVSTTLTAATVNLAVPSSGTVRFRVRAVDTAGNVGTWATGRNLTLRLVQQSPTLVRYSRTWTPVWSARFSGGSARYARTAGASASYTFSGRAVGLVTTTATTRGKVKVYVNGVYQATVDLRSSSTRYRVLVWQKTWSTSAIRTVRLVVVGTSGRPRVDLDAFVTVK